MSPRTRKAFRRKYGRETWLYRQSVAQAAHGLTDAGRIVLDATEPHERPAFRRELEAVFARLVAADAALKGIQ